MKKHIIIYILIVIFGLFSILISSPITTYSKSSYNDHSHFFRDIVSQNSEFKNVSLTKISMLGSHDALSDKIDYYSAPNKSEDNIVNNSLLRFLGKGMMVRLARAQSEDVYKQLCAGARYLDVRVCNVDGIFYNSHGLISEEFGNNLKLILKFLDDNPGEFILFNINKYYEGNSNFNELEEFIKTVKYNNKNLFDYVNYQNINSFSKLTYSNITDDGKKAGVVLFSQADNRSGIFSLLDSNDIISNWHHEIDSNTLIKKIKEECIKEKNMDIKYLRINQAQTSPSTKDAFKTVTSWSLLHHAKEHNVNLLGQPDIKDIIDSIPIYMVDYVTCGYKDFNNRIIDLLSERNITLK